MSGLVEKSLDIAEEKFKNFGFSDVHITQLLSSAKRDLEGEIVKLEEALNSQEPDIEKINHMLHALKGLLYNMGNIEAGDTMTELKNDSTVSEKIEKIRRTLYDG